MESALDKQIAALQRLGVAELRARYTDLFGEPRADIHSISEETPRNSIGIRAVNSSVIGREF